MNTDFSAIQTFYIDGDALNNAATVGILNVGIFFKKKPEATQNSSGIYKPGVSLWICEVVNDQPDVTKVVQGSLTRLEFDQITAFSDARGAAYFNFAQRISLKTNTFYGIVLKYDDPAYKVWTNKIGDKLVGTNNKSTGQSGWIGAKTWDGKYYEGNALGTLIPLSDTDMKFVIVGGKYTSNSVTIEIVNRDYEFITANNFSGTFKGGELAYQNSVANSAGTISVKAGNNTIVGTGTNFTSVLLNSYITLFNGSNVNIVQVSSVTNTTVLTLASTPNFTNTSSVYKVAPVAKIYQVDKINKKVRLIDSSANTTNKFGAGNTIYGSVSGASCEIVSVDDIAIDDFVPYYNINIPASGQLSVQYKICYSNGSSYVMPSSYQNMSLGISNKVQGYSGVIRSRSLEVDSAYLYGSTRKSSVQKLTLAVTQSNSALYETPHFDINELDISLRKNLISNTYTVTTGGVAYDTEVNKNGGVARSKHISKRVAFANNRFAEDVRVFLTGYRPTGTDIKVYCKVHNSSDYESFDDKAWTPLTCYDNSGKYSSSTNASDLVEYTFGLPKYSDTANTLDGTFTTENGNTIILSNGVDPSTYVSANDAIKIYNPSIPENYMVAIVTAANSTSITIGETVSNVNIVGTGFKVDKLKYPNIAFTDPLNYYVSKYFNNSWAEYNKFDSMQIKIVLLADNTNIVPFVDTVQVVGVSA